MAHIINPGFNRHYPKRLIARDPDNEDLIEQLADIYYSLSDYARAEAFYKKVMEEGGDRDTIRKLAEVLIWQKKHDEGLTLLEDMIEEEPKDYAILEFYADVSSWAGKYERSIDAYLKVLSAGEGNARTVLKLADTLRFAGRNEEAVKVYKDYLEEGE